ncbi:MAG: hypothetical protein IT319_22590 [Anaerolineae bacterium]|nr:hypothetical protein [Anaerolineae bacterium]
MLRRFALLLALMLIVALPVAAQDGLNLPADLYVLLNNGQIQRYGVGASGVGDLTPEGLFIVDFGVDSLGEEIAFRTESGLFTINVAAGGQPQQVEGASADVPAYRGAGETMAWSPNGDAIAYTTTYGARIYFNTGAEPVFADLREAVFKSVNWSPAGRFLAAEGENNVWWIYRREGYALTLTSIIPSSIGTTWISDGEVIFAPAEGSLRLMNLDQANAQAVLLDESVIYRLPELNAQDALVFFGRDPADANVPDGYGRLLRLVRGAQQLETIGQVPIALNGLLWAPGGTLLTAYQGGVIALYDPSTGLGFPLPMTDVVAYAWGPLSGTTAPAVPQQGAPPSDATAPPELPSTIPLVETPASAEPTTAPAVQEPASTVTALTVAADSFFLAPTPRGIVQVWKMPANGVPPQPFTLSGSDVNEFAASPDGNKVAYVVDAELWLQQTGFQPEMLARINSFAPVEADFSPDSASLAYIDERSGVWLNVLEENAPQLVLANNEATYHRPRFSPDGTHLLLEIFNDEGLFTGVLNISTRELVMSPITSDDDPRPVRTQWLRDGRIYSYVDASTPSSFPPGFYVVDATALGSAPGQWIPFEDGVTVRSSVEAVSGTLRALVAGGSGAFAPLSVVDYDLTSGEPTTILEIGSLIAPQLSPEGRFVGGYESLNQIDGVQQGAIVMVDLTSGRRFQLSNPPAAWNFRWATP